MERLEKELVELVNKILITSFRKLIYKKPDTNIYLNLIMKEKNKDKELNIEIQVCPRCLSQKILRLNPSNGDMAGAMAILPPKYVCQECEWVGRIVIMKKIEQSKNDATNE